MKTCFLPSMARNCSTAWFHGEFTKDLIPTMLLSHPTTSYSPLLAPPAASQAPSPTHTGEGTGRVHKGLSAWPPNGT